MENVIHTTTPHLLWLLLVLANFIIQLAFFKRPTRGLYIAKRVTTPLMLLGALLVIRISSDAIPMVQGLILAAMGLGEIGIEGSHIVESGDDPERMPWIVTAAGALFLMVNGFLGAILLLHAGSPGILLLGIAAGIITVAATGYALMRSHSPDREKRLQIILYGTGLSILAAGAIAALAGDITAGRVLGHLGIAAAILTVSDSLVLWRMGANWKMDSPMDRRKLLSFLVIILLLYYLYTGVLIDSASPFAAG